MAKKILVVDDEERMRKLVKDFLVRAGYEVLEAEDGEACVDLFFRDKSIDLILLDVMMPRMDGWSTLSMIREFSQIPVFMLTARSEERDELKGYQLGVDEYITKPFSPRVLVARVDAMFRRMGGEAEVILEMGGICLNKSAHQVLAGGKELDLSVKEYELLQYFMENPGIALSREMILNHVWDYTYEGDVRTIDTHVKKLRSKLGEYGNQIRTVWGMGYKFEVGDRS